ncbi:YhzD family protein [Siminovitchia sp. 179-K 8D1 HS]|uniref:YhzD family protein n=1 Tax=Siminovitchia sp. 179-K 8D1 HS TaxID=3142385 RepID=UPI0039A0D90F
MGAYQLTAFERTGEKLLDETFEAENENEAKRKGNAMLAEKGLLDKTHRCTTQAGKLILFHR